MEVIIWVLVAYGITSIVVEGSIFYPLIEKTTGKLNDLLTCPLCFGTWVGFIMGLIYSPIAIHVELPVIVDVFACGMLSAGSIWLITKLTEK